MSGRVGDLELVIRAELARYVHDQPRENRASRGNGRRQRIAVHTRPPLEKRVTDRIRDERAGRRDAPGGPRPVPGG